MKKSISFLLLLGFIASSNHLFGQAFSRASYQKALFLTARFYGGQRSTVKNGVAANWLTQNHTYNSVTGLDFGADADAGYDVSGGWSDCGDNVKFGQTQYYSAYVLLKGYDLWPGGYEDHYSQNYVGYNSKQDYTWEGTAHDPDGIPDILNEVKHATDYFIKCTPNGTTFYYQVGNGTPDHVMWITTVMKAQQSTANGGEPRSAYKNPSDADMPAFCGATLALMSRKYRSIDAAYADTCLAHALNAYTYAKAHPGTAGAQEGSFYGANASWQPAYACLCTELYLATNTASYKTEATNQSGNIKNHYYCFGYANNDDIAAYNLATLGDANSATLLNTFATTYKGAVTNNIYNGGNTSWGPLRYNANAAFVVALNNLYKGTTGVDAFIYNQIDFIMGNNTITTSSITKNVSFIVGLNATTSAGATTTSVKHPHHRNVYLDDNNSGTSNLNIPSRNAQFGYLVGGVRSGNYDDTMGSYQVTEGGIDYSACLVGVLAYIMNQTNTSNPTPTVTISTPANNASVCAGSITITALPTVSTGSISKVDYYDGTTLLGTVSASPFTYTWTTATSGSHTVGVIATSAASVASSKVTVTVTVTASPTISAGSAIAVCSGTPTILTATGGSTYKWSNGTTTASNTVSPTATTTYSVTGTNASCSATGSVVVTVNAVPSAPTVTSPVTYTTSATATALTATGTSLKWYTVASGGTGSATAPNPSTASVGSTNYYVSQTVNTCESPRATIVVNITQGTVTQTVSLVQGWNLVSFNVVPTDSSIATVFGGVMSNLSEVKTADGFYSTINASTAFNSLLSIQQGKGYLVKMKAAASLTVTGIPTSMTAATLLNNIKTGWNIVGCIYQTSTAIATAFDITKINTLKNFSGFYVPNGTTNSLANVVPGYGYFVNKK